VPIFINGVEAHTIVRDLLTTRHEQLQRLRGSKECDTLRLGDAVEVDAIVNTIGEADIYLNILLYTSVRIVS
jgi:magnesium chelatase subunit H